MNVTINGKDYTLHFGFKFIEVINNLRGMKTDVEGATFNTQTQGLTFLNIALSSYDPTGVFDAIKAGTATEKSKPSNAGIEAYITELMESKKIEDYTNFVDELAEEIKKTPYMKLLEKLNK